MVAAAKKAARGGHMSGFYRVREVHSRKLTKLSHEETHLRGRQNVRRWTRCQHPPRRRPASDTADPLNISLSELVCG